MPSFRLTERAKADLRAIGRYTQATWGREQRNSYLARLDACFHLSYCMVSTRESTTNISPFWKSRPQNTETGTSMASKDPIRILSRIPGML